MLVGSFCSSIGILILQNPPDWQEILKYFRGSELQNYFTRILEDTLKVLSKLDCVLLCVCLFLFMIHYYLFDGVIISRFRGLTHTLNVHFDWSTSVDFTSDSKCTYSCIIFILIMFTCVSNLCSKHSRSLCLVLATPGVEVFVVQY